MTMTRKEYLTEAMWSNLWHLAPVFVVLAANVQHALVEALSDNPIIFTVLLARNKEAVLPYFLTYFEQLSYPKEHMILYVRADHCQDNTIPILEDWLDRNRHLYKLIDSVTDRSATSHPAEGSPSDQTDEWFSAVATVREEALARARMLYVDYAFFLDTDVILTDANVIQKLMSEGELIVAPMLQAVEPYTNFWADTDDHFWFRTSAEQSKIASRDEIGCFPVSVVHTCFIVDMRSTAEYKLTFLPPNNEIDFPNDDIISFAYSAWVEDVDQVICNSELYGYMMPSLECGDDKETQYQHLTELKIIAMEKYGLLDVSEPLRKFARDLAHPKATVGIRFIPQVYYINLNRRPERRRKMEKLLEVLRLPATRVSAIDGRLADMTGLEKAGIRALEGYQDSQLLENITKGEVGCMLSHYVVWQDIVDQEYENAMVLEDDLAVVPRFRSKLEHLMADLSVAELDWDMIYLGWKNANVETIQEVKDVPQLVHAVYSHWTIGYVLSQQGARKLLNADPLTKIIPVDELLPILYGKTVLQEYAHHFPAPTLNVFSADPVLVDPQYYATDPDYLSDTVPSTDDASAGSNITEQVANPCLDYLVMRVKTTKKTAAPSRQACFSG